MRAARLLSVLLLLQTRGRMTAQQLADELEVSVRTIYRDVESLHAAGVPLYGDAGWSGGYQLLDGYRTRLTGLTTDEAESLFLSGLPGPAAELGLGAVVTAAQLKLMAALPAELRDRAGRIRQRFHLDAPGWYSRTDDAPHLLAVAAAVWGEHRIRIRYRRWEAPREVVRTLDPYGLVLKGGRWYLIAAAKGKPRTYRVSEILELHPLDEPFERPDFDLAAYWQSYLDEFDRRRQTGEATVLLSPRGFQRLRDLFGQAVAEAAARNRSEVDGWIRTTIPIEEQGHALGQMLRLGTDVRVLEPIELRDLIAATVKELDGYYAQIRD
ncbi:MAG TPA: YafY family protein [Candidatus Limnocylindrales bacterium]